MPQCLLLRHIAAVGHVSRSGDGNGSDTKQWRSCADAAAARYSKSSETAQQVARLAALACSAEKKQASQAITQVEGVGFAAEYIEAAERFYVDRLSVNVIEMRLHGTEMIRLAIPLLLARAGPIGPFDANDSERTSARTARDVLTGAASFSLHLNLMVFY